MVSSRGDIVFAKQLRLDLQRFLWSSLAGCSTFRAAGEFCSFDACISRAAAAIQMASDVIAYRQCLAASGSAAVLLLLLQYWCDGRAPFRIAGEGLSRHREHLELSHCRCHIRRNAVLVPSPDQALVLTLGKVGGACGRRSCFDGLRKR